MATKQTNPRVKSTYTIRNLSKEQYNWLIMSLDAMRVLSEKNELPASIKADNDLINHIVDNSYLEIKYNE